MKITLIELRKRERRRLSDEVFTEYKIVIETLEAGRVTLTDDEAKAIQEGKAAWTIMRAIDR